MQGREPEPHLGLDANQPDDVEVRGRRRHRVEQARLADPGLAPNDEHTAQPVSRLLEEATELGLFSLSADQSVHPTRLVR